MCNCDFLCSPGLSVYHAVYMDNLILDEFKVKLSSLFGIHTQQIGDIYMQGPSQIHILLTDEVGLYPLVYFLFFTLYSA